MDEPIFDFIHRGDPSLGNASNENERGIQLESRDTTKSSGARRTVNVKARHGVAAPIGRPVSTRQKLLSRRLPPVMCRARPLRTAALKVWGG
jgi:hypothetical protein